jgi:hypothetical protein
MRRGIIAAGATLGLALGAVALHAQTGTDAPTAEFQFARLLYNGVPGCASGGGGWRGWGRGRGGAACTDWWDAEYHFMQGVTRLTRIDGAIVEPGGYGGRQLSLAEDAIFDYPWLYAVEVGQWYLSDEEAVLLREYLDRGGFLMVDDFWDEYEWSVFVQSMLRVFPDRPIVELGEDHPLLHVLYDLDQRTQIPGRGGQRADLVPHWRGIFDDDDRLMVAINFNMDMGDAWEHADDPWYPEPMTALAYRFAVNYLIYSMTH